MFPLDVVEKHNHRRKTKPQIQEIELQIYLLDSVANTVMAAYIDQGKRGVVFKTINQTKTKKKTKNKNLLCIESPEERMTHNYTE